MPWWLVTILLVIGIPAVLFILLFFYAAFMQVRYFEDDEEYGDWDDK